jgi:multisubunit Na+/H+ antiporter MnhB subunit
MTPQPATLDEKLKFCIGIGMTMTLMGIVGTVLYSLVFVTQPMGQMAPNDARFFELLFPIATFITGSLGTLLALNTDNGKPKKPDAQPEPTEGV